MEEAIAVFSPSSLLVLANSAYSQLWHDAPGAVCDNSIAEVVRSWQRLSTVSPVWGEARAFVLETGARKPWKGETRLGDGRLLACRFATPAGGGFLIGFAVVPPDRLGGLAGVTTTARPTN